MTFKTSLVLLIILYLSKSSGLYFYINISSSGDLCQVHPTILGLYKSSVNLHNGFPVYKHVNREWHLFVDRLGLWTVNDSVNDSSSILFTNIRPTPPYPPFTGWTHRNGDVWSVDQTIKVEPVCLNSNGTLLVPNTNISSTGPSLSKYPQVFGLYEVLSEREEGSVVFRKKGGLESILVGSTGLWSIYQKLDQQTLYFYSNRQNRPSSFPPPATWTYLDQGVSRNDKYFQVEPVCQQAGQFDDEVSRNDEYLQVEPVCQQLESSKSPSSPTIAISSSTLGSTVSTQTTEAPWIDTGSRCPTSSTCTVHHSMVYFWTLSFYLSLLLYCCQSEFSLELQ